jgi:DNA-binding ferritin-like protein
MNRNTEYFRHLHDVAQRIVDDPRSADADLAAALKSATLKLASRYSNPTQALKQLYSAETELGDLLRRAVAIVTKADAADDGGDDAGDRSDSLADHPIALIARLLVASGGQPDIASALHHLLHKPSGQALLTRLKAADQPAKDTPMESIEKLKAERAQKLLAIGKAGGAVAMAKIINADNDAHGLSEEEYTQILTEHAQKLFPDKTPDGAFAKLFSDNGADGTLLRRAHAVVKLSVFDIQPTQVGGIDAMNAANDDTESSEAYKQLVDMAEKMRAASATPLSSDQAFARVFENPANAKLAAKAHVRPRPTTSYPMPR